MARKLMSSASESFWSKSLLRKRYIKETMRGESRRVRRQRGDGRREGESEMGGSFSSLLADQR